MFGKVEIMNREILDCTLRDGGHINDARFGVKEIKKIEKSLRNANVDIIELGFLKDGCFTDDEANYNRIENARTMISDWEGNQKYSVMIRPDWYDISQLTKCEDNIDMIRFAFYFKDIELTKRYCKYVKALGYKCVLNPVNIIGYSIDELEKLLEEVNMIMPTGFTIVDTFGAMRLKKLEELCTIIEARLDSSIYLGLHLHENMQSSFLLAQYFLECVKKRNVVVDSSLLGMGRNPGNLCTEMILDFMNTAYDKTYKLLPVLNVISSVIEPIKQKYPWGYSPAFYFSGKYEIHRSYAEYFLDKKDLGLDDIFILLTMIKERDKGKAFSIAEAEEIYRRFREKEY